MSQELSELELKYRTIIESGNVAMIVVVDSRGKITEWNSSAEFTFGYHAKEVIGLPLSMLIASQEKSSSIKRLYRTVNRINQKGTGEIVEINGLTKQGYKIPLEFEIRKWATSTGVYYTAIMVDISRRKALENDLFTKTRELDVLLYRCAHDLKAPFCSAEGLISLLKEEKINANALALLQMLETSLEKGKQLLDDLALVSIISKKNRSVSRIDFEEIVKSAFDSIKEFDDYELVNFVLDIDVRQEFLSNRELLISLLKNLIQYAINYSHFECNEKEGSVFLKIKTSEKNAKISIEYHGILEECFHKFKVLDLGNFINDNSMSCAGLGIYVLKNIVDILDGKIKIKRTEVASTVIRIKLPTANPKHTEL